MPIALCAKASNSVRFTVVSLRCGSDSVQAEPPLQRALPAGLQLR